MLQAKTTKPIPHHSPKNIGLHEHWFDMPATSCMLVHLHDKGFLPPHSTHMQSNVKQARTNATSCMLVHLHNKGSHTHSRDE